MSVFTGPRIRDNNVFGTTTDNPLSSGATTMNSAGLANLDAVSSAHAVLVLDPLRATGAPEVVIVTAHTGSATSATITRGAYGTAARSHAQGELWVQPETVDDLIRICTSSTHPADSYIGQLLFETDTAAFKAQSGSAWEQVLTIGTWTSYTPTLTQSTTVTKTVNYAKYLKVGRAVMFAVDLAVTGAGTGANAVTLTVPVTAAVTNLQIGPGAVYDSSASTLYNGNAFLVTATTVNIWPGPDGAASALGVRDFTAALAANDLVRVSGIYEAAA